MKRLLRRVLRAHGRPREELCGDVNIFRIACREWLWSMVIAARVSALQHPGSCLKG